jgi:Flp pilus assembly protein TadB
MNTPPPPSPRWPLTLTLGASNIMLLVGVLIAAWVVRNSALTWSLLVAQFAVLLAQLALLAKFMRSTRRWRQSLGYDR